MTCWAPRTRNDDEIVAFYEDIAAGVPDVPLAWPLRYAHSPAEVIDLRDVQALAQLILVVATGW